MGGKQSTPADEPHVILEMTTEMQALLDSNTYAAGDNSKYPYFLVQLDEDGELPTGPNDDMYVSDAIAAHISKNRVTHIIAQTHGWNTPPEKAVAVPFTEFMGGMQNDKAMPDGDDFHPVFIAFIWPALPLSIAEQQDALTRTELIIDHEKQNNKKTTDILEAAEAAKHAIEKEDPDDEEFQKKMMEMAKHSVDDDDNDDGNEDDAAIKSGHPEVVVDRAKATFAGPLIESLLSVFTPIMRPFENLFFGRLMKRGRTVGMFMGSILGKCMTAAQGRPKTTMMANSLGAHMLVGALKAADRMPYKIHSVFFVQGAISRRDFVEGNRYAPLVKEVAGPFCCTFSDRDFLLKNIFGPFHGDAVGFDGFAEGATIQMKSLEGIASDPYQFELGSCISVNGSNFIDEGDPISGGHGDFKEDETTSLYWSMIKMELHPSAYDR